MITADDPKKSYKLFNVAGCSHLVIKGLKFTKAKTFLNIEANSVKIEKVKGNLKRYITSSESHHIYVVNNLLTDAGQEMIHALQHTHHLWVLGNKIDNAGLVRAGNGEGLYLGTGGHTNHAGRAMDAVYYVRAAGNEFTRCPVESVETKDGCRNIIVERNWSHNHQILQVASFLGMISGDNIDPAEIIFQDNDLWDIKKQGKYNVGNAFAMEASGTYRRNRVWNVQHNPFLFRKGADNDKFVVIIEDNEMSNFGGEAICRDKPAKGTIQAKNNKADKSGGNLEPRPLPTKYEGWDLKKFDPRVKDGAGKPDEKPLIVPPAVTLKDMGELFVLTERDRSEWTDGITLAGDLKIVFEEADGADIEQVTFEIDKQEASVQRQPDYACPISSESLSPGKHKLVVKAVGNGSETVETTFTIGGAETKDAYGRIDQLRAQILDLQEQLTEEWDALKEQAI